MSKIDILRESNSKISKDSTISLLSDLILGKLAKVVDYNKDDTYYRGDLIYRFNNGRHEILECIENEVSGEFDYDKWSQMSLNMSALANGRTDEDELLYIEVITKEADKDGVDKVDLSHIPDLRETNTNAIVMHSVRGIIPRSDFIIDDITREIKLTGWDLDEGEVLNCIIFKFGKPEKRDQAYTNILESKIVSSNLSGEFYNTNLSLDFSKNNYKSICIHSTKGILKETTDYTLNSSGLKLTQKLSGDQFVSLVVFEQAEAKGFNNCVYGIYKFSKPELSNRAFIPIKGFVKGRDRLFVFDRVNGYIPISSYSISEDGREIIFKNLEFMINEELIFIALTENNRIYLPDDFLDINNFSYDIRGHLSPLIGEVLLTLDNPSIEIDIPETAFLNNNYNVKTEVIESSGDVGTIIIKNKSRKGFTIEITGIANKAKIQYTIVPSN